MNEKIEKSDGSDAKKTTPPDRRGSVESTGHNSAHMGTPGNPKTGEKKEAFFNRLNAMQRLTDLAAEQPDVMARLIDQQRRELDKMAGKTEEKKEPTKRRKPGRPRKLDPKNREKVCLLISAGLSQRQAAAYVSCDPSAISHAMRKDEKFATEVKRAMRMSQITPLMSIARAARTSWRAAAWLIKNHRPHALLRREEDLIKDREMIDSLNRMGDQLHAGR